MSAEIHSLPIERNPRDRLSVQAPPQAKPWIVIMRGIPQTAALSKGDAFKIAEAMAAEHPDDPVQVLELVATFLTKRVVQRVAP